MKTELEIVDMTKKFDQKTVLDHMEFIFQQGKIYSILGRNGAGKTTFFNCITGDLLRESGSIRIIQEGHARPVRFDDVGLVSAAPSLPEFLTGYEFIYFFMKLHKQKPDDDTIQKYFQMVNLVEEDQHKLIHAYSYGMKNKIQLLCCLIQKPLVILLDEPLSSFDIIVSHEIKETLIRMKSDHIILMATHIMQLAQDISDEIILLRNGKMETADGLNIHGADFEETIIEKLSEKEADSL